MARSIDHIVLPVYSLAETASTLRAIGFSVTPRAQHPWGTANCLVQFDGVFLEYLEIADETSFPQSLAPNAFSFAHFNRDWLARLGEGASMLVLTSAGANEDRATFEKAGLTVHDPFDFERTAKQPDGSESKVAFSLTFVSDPSMPRIGFFTCDHHYPENFWKPEFQTHGNGAFDLTGLIIVADEPSDHHVMLSNFIGERDMRSTSFGIEIDAGRHRISVLTPIGYERLFGHPYHRARLGEPTIAAIRIGVKDLNIADESLKQSGLMAEVHQNMLILRANDCHGCALIFEETKRNQA